MRLGDLLDRQKLVDPGAVDDDVEPPKRRLGLRKEPLDVRGVGDVGLNRDRPTPLPSISATTRSAPSLLDA
jgi:hypothetical protein